MATPTIATSWHRIREWCDERLPSAAGQLRPPAEIREVNLLTESCPVAWTEDLQSWFKVHDGVIEGESADFAPLIGFRPLSVGEATEWVEVFASTFGFGDHRGAGRAGELAPTFEAAFVPVGVNVTADLLFVDLRGGGWHGCVSAYERDEGYIGRPLWQSLAQMLAECERALWNAEPVEGLRPRVVDDALLWEPLP